MHEGHGAWPHGTRVGDEVVRGHALEHRRGGDREVEPVRDGDEVVDGTVHQGRGAAESLAPRHPVADRETLHAVPDCGHGAGALEQAVNGVGIR